MNPLTNEQYQQLENYWHTASSWLGDFNIERDPQRRKESDWNLQIITKQFHSMGEEEQGAFGTVLEVSRDEDIAEELPLTLKQLEVVRKRVLNETYRLLAADHYFLREVDAE